MFGSKLIGKKISQTLPKANTDKCQALKDQAKFNQLSSNNFRQCLPFCSDSAESRSFNPPKLWANLVEAGLHLLNKTAQLCKRNTNQQRQQKSHAGACFTQWEISKFLLFKNTAYSDQEVSSVTSVVECC